MECGAWRGQAVGISPTERPKLRRQMVAAAGKKESWGGRRVGGRHGQKNNRRH